MSTYLPTTEALTKASQTSAMLIADLRVALQGATAVEALVLLPLIQQVAALSQGIDALVLAHSSA